MEWPFAAAFEIHAIAKLVSDWVGAGTGGAEPLHGFSVALFGGLMQPVKYPVVGVAHVQH